jgi:Na+/serine symporter
MRLNQLDSSINSARQVIEEAAEQQGKKLEHSRWITCVVSRRVVPCRAVSHHRTHGLVVCIFIRFYIGCMLFVFLVVNRVLLLWEWLVRAVASVAECCARAREISFLSGLCLF